MRVLLITFFGLLLGHALTAQNILHGVVRDKDGTPIIGANAVVKGTDLGVPTNADGMFTLQVTQGVIDLEVSYIGYITEVIRVEFADTRERRIEVTLKEDMQLIEDLVVIGYGVQRKSDLTGSVASVRVEELSRGAAIGIERALQGKAAGVQVAPASGAPGASVKIRVRGISSLSAGDPIWIVDGVPAGANSVNVSDIESIEILKDAATAAIYGSNGANGVILITTKRGKPGKPMVNLNYFRGWQSNPNRIDMASGPEFGSMYTEMQAVRLGPNGGNIRQVQFPNFLTMPTYDYQDMVFRQAAMHNLDFNVSGGTEHLSTYLGIGLIDQEGIMKSTDFERFNFRLNTNYKVNKWFTIGQTATYNQQNTVGLDEWQYQNEYENPLVAAIAVHPYLPPYDDNGNWTPRTIGASETPMPQIDMLNRQNRFQSGNAMIYARIEPIKGLALESRVSSNLGFGDSYDFTPTFRFGSSLGQFNEISQIDRRMERHFGYNWQNTISYSTTLLDRINLSALVGYEEGASRGHDIHGLRRSLLTEEPEMWYFDASLDDTTLTQLIKGGGYQSAGYSYLGRLNLDYRSKYLLQINFRRDYSSKFGPDNRVGNFPGISAGWKFSDEDFVRDGFPVLSFGKVRGSWGRAGNSNIRDYAYFATVGAFEVFSYSFNNSGLSQGAAPDVLPNRSIHWEDIETQNLGLDLAFLNNRLEVNVDWFRRHNIGMLIPTTVPSFAGWTVRDTYQEGGGVDPRPIENVGRITNQGWEFQLGWRESVGRLKYSANLNYSYVRNIATDLGPDSVRTGGSFLGHTNFCRTETGGYIGNFYGFRVERIFTEADAGILPNGDRGIVNQPYTINEDGERVYAQDRALPGDFQFADTNNDGQLNSEDQTVLGNPFPKHLLGLNLSLEYRMFDLFMFWQGALGHQIWNAAKFYGVNQSGLYNWSRDYINNHYRGSDIEARDVDGNLIAVYPANINAEYPRIDPTNRNDNFRPSSFFVEDGDYLRLKNLQLGFTLPAEWTTRIQVSHLRVYLGAQNLLTFTRYSGMDPEVAQSEVLVAGIDKSSYPQARMYTMGITMSF